MGGQLIEGKRDNLYLVDPDDVTIIGIDTNDGPEHYLYDERVKLPLDEAMVLNVMALGVREPVSVTVDGKGDKKRILVVDGRRRVMHARAANKRLKKDGEPLVMLPVWPGKGLDEEKTMAIAVSLNEIRVQDPVMIKAAKAARMKARNHSNADIARAFGMDEQTIWTWLRIETLSPAVKRAINGGIPGVVVTPTAAAKLADLPKDEQESALKQLIEEARAEGSQTVTVGKAGAVARAKRTGDEVKLTPSRRTLRYVTEHGKEHKLSDEFLAGIRFAIGELNPKTISGLVSLMRESQPNKKKERAAKAAKKSDEDEAEAAE